MAKSASELWDLLHEAASSMDMESDLYARVSNALDEGVEAEAKNAREKHSGSKYLREIRCLVDGRVDVYAILEAFAVTCPARQHAIKKLLCSGIRGKGDTAQDLNEARDAIDRAVQMELSRLQLLSDPSVKAF